MIYYEAITDKERFRHTGFYTAHEITDIEVLSENPCFADSPWLMIRTKSGKTFYQDKNRLDDMQNHPEFYPVKEKGGKKEAVPA